MGEREGYKKALEEARKDLSNFKVEDICRRTKAQYLEKEECLALSYLNYRIRVKLPEFSFLSRELNPQLQVLLLHYLRDAQEVESSGNLVSFRELPQGITYYPSFQARAENLIARTFGRRKEEFRKISLSLGGRETALGDIGMKIVALSRVPLIYILWEENGEFSSRASILFDETAPRHLEIEDLAILGELVSREMVERRNLCNQV